MLNLQLISHRFKHEAKIKPYQGESNITPAEVKKSYIIKLLGIQIFTIVLLVLVIKLMKDLKGPNDGVVWALSAFLIGNVYKMYKIMLVNNINKKIYIYTT